MFDLIISTLTQGFIYALLSYGIYITYKILDFPDLTVDGSFPLGAAITAVLLVKGMNPFLVLSAALLVGAAAGLVTGVIHVKFGVRDLLAGIITMTALFSINLQIAGSNLAVERAIGTIYTSGPIMAVMGNSTLMMRKFVVSLLVAMIFKFILDWYLKTKSGMLLRAVGDNSTLVTTLAKDKGIVKIIGLTVANALVAFSGALVCMEQRAFSSTMGTGQMVFGLAADNKGKPFGLGRGVNKARENFYKEQLSILGLGLENKMNVKLGALSGGQRQAATLIMATLTPIEFLILDEHTAALDPKTADIIMELTNKVVQEKHLTAMMVTHNLRYAVEYGSRLIMMDKGHIVLDKAGEEKVNTKVDDILDIFTKISIECGN